MFRCSKTVALVTQVLGGDVEQQPHVGVVERVVDHPAAAPVAHDARRPQQPQGVRHRRLGHVDDGRDVAHAQLAGLAEGVQDLDARRDRRAGGTARSHG